MTTMTSCHNTNVGQLNAQPKPAIRTITSLVDILYRWQQRASERHHLRHLSDHMLKDMGLHRADIAAEVSKPFWRA